MSDRALLPKYVSTLSNYGKLPIGNLNNDEQYLLQ